MKNEGEMLDCVGKKSLKIWEQPSVIYKGRLNGRWKSFGFYASETEEGGKWEREMEIERDSLCCEALPSHCLSSLCLIGLPPLSIPPLLLPPSFPSSPPSSDESNGQSAPEAAGPVPPPPPSPPSSSISPLSYSSSHTPSLLSLPSCWIGWGKDA